MEDSTTSQSPSYKPALQTLDETQQHNHLTSTSHSNSTSRSSTSNVINQNNKENLSWPITTYFILFVELCERFCYYGLRSVLVLFLQDFYGITEKQASEYYHIFGVMCYGFPLVGSVVSDSYWGRYFTIKRLSIVYFIGISLLSISANPTMMPFISSEREYHKMMSLLGIALIGVGAGGIKPCVVAFGADQFQPDQEKAKNQYFQWFYFMINVGAVISAYLTPHLKKIDCYPNFNETFPVEVVKTFEDPNMRLSFDSCHMLSFGLPAILMFFAISAFVLPPFLGWMSSQKSLCLENQKFKSRVQLDLTYSYEPTKEDNVIFRLGKAFLTSFIGLLKGHSNPCNNLKDEGFINKSYEKSSQIRRVTFRVLEITSVFAPICIFYAIFEQMGSLWLFQAKELNGFILKKSYWLPDQMEIWNNFFVVIQIPIWLNVFTPPLDKYVFSKNANWARNKPFILMCSGLVIAGFANLYAAGLQNAIDRSLDFSDFDEKFKFWSLHGVGEANTKQNMQKSPEKSEAINYEPDTYNDFVRSKINDSSYDAGITEENVKNNFPALHIIWPGNTNKHTNEQMNHLRVSAKLINAQKEGLVRILKIDNFTKSANAEPFEVSRENFDLQYLKICKNYVNSGFYVIDERQKGSFSSSPKCHLALNGRSISMGHQIPVYAIATFAEILIATTALEFAYTQAPSSVRTLCTGIWYLTTCMGNVFCILLKKMDFLSRSEQMFCSGVLAFVAAVVFVLIVKRFKILKNSEIDYLNRSDADLGDDSGSNMMTISSSVNNAGVPNSTTGLLSGGQRQG